MDAPSMLSPAVAVVTRFGVQVSSRGAPTNAAACPEACAGRAAGGDLVAGLCRALAPRSSRSTRHPDSTSPGGTGGSHSPGTLPGSWESSEP